MKATNKVKKHPNTNNKGKQTFSHSNNKNIQTNKLVENKYLIWS